jgi:hypothetical protein
MATPVAPKTIMMDYMKGMLYMNIISINRPLRKAVDTLPGVIFQDHFRLLTLIPVCSGPMGRQVIRTRETGGTG